MIPPRLVVATANAGKVRELSVLVREWGAVEVCCLPDSSSPRRRGYVRGERARPGPRRAQARVCPRSPTTPGSSRRPRRWRPCPLGALRADDEARIARLLDALGNAPDPARRARFRCVVALAWPDGRVVTAEGTCEGRIARAPAGAGGFGYDPIFVADELGRTLAATPAADKARVSHRARAMRTLGARLGAA